MHGEFANVYAGHLLELGDEISRLGSSDTFRSPQGCRLNYIARIFHSDDGADDAR